MRCCENCKFFVDEYHAEETYCNSWDTIISLPTDETVCTRWVYANDCEYDESNDKRRYELRYRGCYEGDIPDPNDKDVGKIVEWTMSEILNEINRDRSSGWTDYDETDWEEGLKWTYYELVK